MQQCRKATKSQINGQINGRRTYVEGKMGTEGLEEGKTGVMAPNQESRVRDISNPED